MTRVIVRSWVGSWVSLGIALLSGCPTPIDEDLLYREDFETLCDGTPCDWVQSGGAEGNVRWIETVPGDHGLELIGDGVSVRGSGPGELARATIADRIAVRTVARCDVGSSIEIRVTVGTTDAILTFDAEIVPESTWSMAHPDETLDPTEPTTPPWTISRIAGVSLLKHGEGRCELDFLGVRAIPAF
jgi:hypothetical protein